MSQSESNRKDEVRHDAFISYSRRDREFARALGDTLKGYRPPKDLNVAQRHLDIFRDEEDFTGVEYNSAVSRHLRESGRLILVCSPRSRQSQYVEGEIRQFASMRGADNILPVLIAGLPNNEAQPGQEDQMAFADALCHVLEMPLAIDYRGFDARKDRVNKGAWQTPWFSLLAAIYGLSRGQIEQREKRREARRRRVTRGIVAGVMVTLLAATIVSLFFWRRAVEQRTVAVARQLAAQAELVRNQGRQMIERSVLLSVESMKRVPTLEADLVLRPQLRLLPRPAAVISVDGGIYQTAFSADGRFIATDSTKGVSVWELPSGRKVADLPAIMPIATIAFSPDGGQVATGSGAILSGSDTYLAQVWDLQRGREVARLPHEEPVYRVAFNADGRYLATADGPRARVFELGTGKTILKAPHEATVLFIALSPDGQRLATQTNRGLNQIWNVPQGVVEPESKLKSRLGGVAFSPDWTREATIDGSTLRIVETQTGRELARINEPNVESLRFVADGEWVVASVRGGARIVWKASNGEEVVRLDKAGEVTDVAISPDRRYLATCSKDHVAQIWDLTGEEVTRLFHEYIGKENMSTVTFTANGGHLVTADIMGTVRVWETTAGREVATFVHEGRVSAIAYTPDGKHIVTNSDDNSVRVWDANSEREITRVRSEYGVPSFALSPVDGKFLAVALERETQVLDTHTGQVITRLKLTGAVAHTIFSPDGGRLATAGSDNVARIWDASSWREIATMPHDDSLAAIAFSPDGKYLATATINSDLVLVWNGTTGREVSRRHLGKESNLQTLVFSPDGRYLSVVSFLNVGSAVIILDPVSGREIRRLSHEGVYFLTFSRDGKLMATGGHDGNAILWRVSNGEMISRLPHRGVVSAVIFNKDGTHLLTGCLDGAARIWNTRTGRELSRMQMPSGILAMAVSPDGRYLTTGGGGGKAHTWYLRSSDLLEEAYRRLPRNLTRAEWDQFVGDEPYSATCPNLPVPP